ncbi:putative alternative oxidase [Danaus plexippus plexippus]|uniref:Alternative oxidase n=1 Tax=Danaus plexippus plexippus TaxID=278856 RepID=A0A212ESY6_DANPL|nr:putative alternative oxidase [Danaus plexippus plexippus]
MLTTYLTTVCAFQEQISVSSPDFSDTDSNYAPPVQDTSSDESYLYDDKILDRFCSFGNVPHSSEKFHQKNYSLLELKPISDKNIEQPLNEETSVICSDSILSDISNSPGTTLSVDSRLLKPVSISTHKSNSVVSGDTATVSISNHTQEDERTNDDDFIIPKKPPKCNRAIRSKDYCFFCEVFVLNFARHLTRHHVYEPEVQKILSVSKKSQERKNLIMALRKKGNFIQNSVEITKPMRKQKFTDYLPCTNCLGFYSKKLLWKHMKKCTQNSNKTTVNVQSEAQNLLLRHLKIDEKLKDTVFLRMRADKTSLVAKSDVLICSFGTQYMKTHREKHFVNVISRKMRELAKLLQEMKKINPSIKDLFDALRPIHYDTIVAATKIVGKYDSEKDRFESPTFAMNISTSIKQCCNIAILFALKKHGPYMETNTAEIEADLKTLIQIIDSNWKFDISSQAASDLNTNKWNKVTIVPLANHLKILKEYLGKKSEEAANKIKEGLFNVSTYIQLLETVYCRVLLLNRRRPGELQRIKVHDYLESDNNAADKYEEFDRALTLSERVLVQKFKRVVIRGKRERGVPVLFNKEVQEDIKLLLSIRNTFVSTSNRFLFGNPGFENTIYGYKVLERHARLSGAKNPKSISSTRLRKHLATLSQIFSMSENDMEQLATFMGHTSDVHKKSYRLPDDIYQTAKISKLLILMEDGKADAFRGKSLDEIELDLNEQLDEGMTENEVILDYDVESPGRTQDITDGNKLRLPRSTSPPPQPGPSGLQTNTFESVHHVKKGKKRTLIPWTAEQKKVCSAFFKHHIKMKQPPKRHECEALKEKHRDLLHNKDWLKIKVFIQNIYNKK